MEKQRYINATYLDVNQYCTSFDRKDYIDLLRYVHKLKVLCRSPYKFLKGALTFIAANKSTVTAMCSIKSLKNIFFEKWQRFSNTKKLEKAELAAMMRIIRTLLSEVRYRKKVKILIAGQTTNFCTPCFSQARPGRSHASFQLKEIKDRIQLINGECHLTENNWEVNCRATKLCQLVSLKSTGTHYLLSWSFIGLKK